MSEAKSIPKSSPECCENDEYDPIDIIKNYQPTSLKPCPFCGREGEIVDNFFAGQPIDGISHRQFSVRHVCNPTSKTPGLFCQTTWFDTKAEAAALWNNRKSWRIAFNEW